LAGGAFAAAAAARWADVVYSTGMYSRSALAAAINRVPLVMKMASDPAYERARRLGLFTGRLEAFQERQASRRLKALMALRTMVVRRADRMVIPSAYLAEIVAGWGISGVGVSVVPNPAPAMDGLAGHDEMRRQLGIDGVTFAFVGRLVRQKRVDWALTALEHVPQASLVIVGDGPDRESLKTAVARAGLGDRVRMTGALPRAEAVRWLRAADAAVLSSEWENFPHAAVEALAAGTPVLATAVGGIPEVIQTGVNGVLVPPGDTHQLAAAMRSVATDPELLARLRAGATASAGRYSADQAFEAIERVLADAVGVWRSRRGM
jgi:glycosyltransferase involved in cell wall biosynthesis